MTEFPHNTSEFDRFLFASLCEEDDISLSILSVLARQDVDPWQEAARLAQIPKEEAINSLASKIWKSNSERWSPSQASALAGHLIELLPSTRRPHASPLKVANNESQLMMWLIYGILLGTIAISGHNTQQSAKNLDNSSFTSSATVAQRGLLRSVNTD